MKDKSKAILIVVILIVAAIIAYVCYGITRGVKNPIVTMEVSYADSEGNQKTGTVKIELYPDVAPQSVSNFIALANNGFYDELTFHRIAKDFVVQGGDKAGDGSGSAKLSDIDKSIVADSSTDYEYSIKGEFYANGVNNDIKFEKGIIAMARSDWSSYGLTQEGYNSASSQFFFVTTDKKSSLNSLNQNYAPFGKVIEGYEFIDEIATIYAVDESAQTTNENTTEGSSSEEVTAKNGTEENTTDNTENNNVPKMTSVRVETFGAKYELPNALNQKNALDQISQYNNYYQQLLNSQSGDTNAVVEGAE